MRKLLDGPTAVQEKNISCLSCLVLGTTQLFCWSFVFRRLQGKQLETFGKTSHEIAAAICSNGVQPSSIILVQKLANPAGIANQAASIVCSCKQQRVRRRHGYSSFERELKANDWATKATVQAIPAKMNPEAMDGPSKCHVCRSQSALDGKIGKYCPRYNGVQETACQSNNAAFKSSKVTQQNPI